MQVVGLDFYFYEKQMSCWSLERCSSFCFVASYLRIGDRLLGEVDDVVHSVCGEDVLAGQLILFDAQFLLRCLWTLLLLSRFSVSGY
jgi:hypothetical protein